MTAVALPWFVLVTTGSPARMGAVLAAEFAGLTLLGLVGGRPATALGPRAHHAQLRPDPGRSDRADSRCCHLGWLSFPADPGIAFVVGGFFPAYQSSGRLLVAGLVEDDELRLTRVGGLLNAVNETASFLGPPLGGLLVVLLGPAPVLLLDAASYGLAFLLIGTLVPGTVSEAPAEDTSVRGGLRYLWHDRRLRRLVLGVGVSRSGSPRSLPPRRSLPCSSPGDSTMECPPAVTGGASVAGWLLGAYGAGSVVGGLISTRARATGGRTPALAIAGSPRRRGHCCCPYRYGVGRWRSPGSESRRACSSRGSSPR